MRWSPMTNVEFYVHTFSLSFSTDVTVSSKAAYTLTIESHFF